MGTTRRRSEGESRVASRRKRKPISSSDNSDSSDHDTQKKKKRSREITEEEINAYVAKKAQKKAEKVAKKMKKDRFSGYSNDSNPFHDSNLNEKFVWRKKIERDVANGATLEKFSMKAEKIRQKELEEEIENVRKRREERAIQKAQREEERAMLEKERVKAEYQDFEKKEDEFQYNQSRIRTEIRMQEGRCKPIDIFCNYLDDTNNNYLEEPSMLFKGLEVEELEELRGDIQLNRDLDKKTPMHVEFWQALLVVCDTELVEAHRKSGDVSRGELHASIESDVENILQGKTCKELERLQSEIESRMRSGSAKVVEFWEVVLKRIPIYKAKATLKEIHAKVLRRHLQNHGYPLEKKEQFENHNECKSLEEDVSDDQVDDRSYSPEPMTDNSEEAIDPEQDRAELEKRRVSVLQQQQVRFRNSLASREIPPERNLELKAMKSMGEMDEGDAILGSGAEINLESSQYHWQDKYRPRKPKYFNRVHSGYEWNKYNRVHYDHDNPPPKMVQGYKFNIFYPDLVDKSKTPMFVVEKDQSDNDTCIIRFHAGPPYEDIAFRIANKEWEYSHKKGFKCTFDRGILHLYFNFVRYRYRR
ncbi:hypothetical protein ACHQM5_023316 [Ranunculus cassubicifolius]